MMPKLSINLLVASVLLLGVTMPVGPDGSSILIKPAYADDGDGGDGDGDGGDNGDDGDDRDDDDRDDDDRGGRTGGRGVSGGGDQWAPQLLRKIFRPRANQRRRTTTRQAAPPPPRPAFADAEIVSLDLNEEDLAQLLSEGFDLIEERNLDGFQDVTMRRLGAPDGISLTEARDRVRALPSGESTDFNHYYRSDQHKNSGTSDCAGPHCGNRQMIDWPNDAALLDTCLGDVMIGMIDTGLNEAHETFAGADLSVHRLASESMEPSRAIHGTAIAALLVGSNDSRSPGLLPGARMAAVDAFHRMRGDERSDVFSLVSGLSYLAEQNVGVINLSLAGPANIVLEKALADLAEDGIIAVAATGNAGARSEPLFPAAYKDVIAVTAVDRGKRVYRRAVQGAHVDFAAPGVEVWTAASIKGARWKTGTSFAVPFVTAAIALILAENPELGSEEVKALLAASATDLGEPGLDPVYGHGLISFRELCRN